MFLFQAARVITGTRVHNLTSFIRNKRLRHCLNSDGAIKLRKNKNPSGASSATEGMHRSSFSITGHINCIRLRLHDTAC